MSQPKRPVGKSHHINPWDVHSMYPGCLEGDLPWEGTWATEAEIAALNLDTFLFTATSKMYLIECDVVMNKAEWYPMSGEHTADPSAPKVDYGCKPTKLEADTSLSERRGKMALYHLLVMLCLEHDSSPSGCASSFAKAPLRSGELGTERA